MEVFWEELTFGFSGSKQVTQVIIRIIASILLGAVIGIEREWTGKPAGVRTHILVSLGTTIFVVGCSLGGLSSEGLSRVIQGIVTGIGFIGAGAILKLDDKRDVKGLTTSASIWVTCAIGVVIALGEVGLAIVATVLTFFVLALVISVEKLFKKREKENKTEAEK